MAATDDPEALEVYRAVKAHAGDDPDIHIYVDGALIGAEEVAAVQSAADVVVQKSLREGFGLSATEAMWKGAPLIAGDCGGLRLQVRHGDTGYLVRGVEECAGRIVEVLNDRGRVRVMARRAREQARARFLMPRLVRDHLGLYAALLQPASRPATIDDAVAAGM
jgi:trehalose synthase